MNVLDRNPRMVDTFEEKDDKRVEVFSNPVTIKAMLIIGDGEIIFENKKGYEIYRQSIKYRRLPDVNLTQKVFISKKSKTDKIEKVLIYA